MSKFYQILSTFLKTFQFIHHMPNFGGISTVCPNALYFNLYAGSGYINDILKFSLYPPYTQTLDISTVYTILVIPGIGVSSRCPNSGFRHCMRKLWV